MELLNSWIAIILSAITIVGAIAGFIRWMGMKQKTAAEQQQQSDDDNWLSQERGANNSASTPVIAVEPGSANERRCERLVAGKKLVRRGHGLYDIVR